MNSPQGQPQQQQQQQTHPQSSFSALGVEPANTQCKVVCVCVGGVVLSALSINTDDAYRVDQSLRSTSKYRSLALLAFQDSQRKTASAVGVPGVAELMTPAGWNSYEEPRAILLQPFFFVLCSIVVCLLGFQVPQGDRSSSPGSVMCICRVQPLSCSPSSM